MNVASSPEPSIAKNKINLEKLSPALINPLSSSKEISTNFYTFQSDQMRPSSPLSPSARPAAIQIVKTGPTGTTKMVKQMNLQANVEFSKPNMVLSNPINEDANEHRETMRSTTPG